MNHVELEVLELNLTPGLEIYQHWPLSQRQRGPYPLQRSHVELM